LKRNVADRVSDEEGSVAVLVFLWKDFRLQKARVEWADFVDGVEACLNYFDFLLNLSFYYCHAEAEVSVEWRNL